MKLLVTGGAGFIGSNFVRFWLGRHSRDEVVNYDLLTYAGDRSSLADVEQSAPARYRFEQGDIADASNVRRVLETHRPDVIVKLRGRVPQQPRGARSCGVHADERRRHADPPS